MLANSHSMVVGDSTNVHLLSYRHDSGSATVKVIMHVWQTLGDKVTINITFSHSNTPYTS